MELENIQEHLKTSGIDGWLFYDHHNRDLLAYSILQLDTKQITSRRWFYFVPTIGEPVKIVHNVESHRLDALPGTELFYSSWKDLHTSLSRVLAGRRNVAMQYSPNNNIPQISIVDGGTIELVRDLGVNVVSSADLVQVFVARLDEEAIKSHIQAGELVQSIKDEAFNLISLSLKTGETYSEHDIQQFIVRRFGEKGLTSGRSLPMVCVDEHAANPHFELDPKNSSKLQKGSTLMIDLWAKLDKPGAIFYDITWCAFLGDSPPDEYRKIFDLVVHARKLAKNLIVERFRQNVPLHGWEVDQVARDYIDQQGFGPYFTHRTGHSIGTENHGFGVNIDNFETKDDRTLIPGICFSLEPGIYKKPFGVRSEINILIDYHGNVLSFGEEQEKLLLL
jgi:Xaa-Pro dipeptidase